MNSYDKLVYQSLGKVKRKYLLDIIEWQTMVIASVRGIEQSDVKEDYSIDPDDNDMILRSKIRNLHAVIIEMREKCKDCLY